MNTVNISDIDTEFNDNTEPQDERFMALLERAYLKEVTCQAAIVDIDLVVPFSNYKPTVSLEFRDDFIEQFEEENPPALYLYEHGGQLIMCDDYAPFALYKEMGVEEVPVIIVGDFTEADGIEPVGDTFYLEPPTIEVLDDIQA